jgi:hypothetical protein
MSAVLILAVLALPKPAAATLSRAFCQAMSAELKVKQAELKRLSLWKAKLKADYEELQGVKERRPGQGACGMCVKQAARCNGATGRPIPEVCSQGECSVELQPVENLCYRIYKNKSCFESALPSYLKPQVLKCWLVDNELKQAKLYNEYNERWTDEMVAEKEVEWLDKQLAEHCPDAAAEKTESEFTGTKTTEPPGEAPSGPSAAPAAKRDAR